MNHITINGTIVKDATKALVNNVGTETPVVTFTLMDSGVPYQKNEPMFIEVHFMQEVAMHIFPYLIKMKPKKGNKNYEKKMKVMMVEKDIL